MFVGDSTESARHDAGSEVSSTSLLTARLAQENEDAFVEFHELYFDRLLRYLLVLLYGDEDAAREVLQEVFLRLVRHIKPFDREERFWSWLTILARSAAIDRQRKRKRYLLFLDRFSKHPPPDLPPAENSDHRLMGLLEESLESLPEEERQLLKRKYMDGHSVQELAMMQDESEKAIESRLTRVRKKLRGLLLKQLQHEK